MGNGPLTATDPLGLLGPCGDACPYIRMDARGDAYLSLFEFWVVDGFGQPVGPDPNEGGRWPNTPLFFAYPYALGQNNTGNGPCTNYVMANCGAANTGTIAPLTGQRYEDALNAYCSARGRAKFVADWLPGGGTIARDIWNSPIGAALGAYQLPTADINRITEDNSGGQSVAMHATSEGLNAAARSTAVVYAIRAQTGVPMSVSSKLLSGAATVVLVADALFGFAKEGQEILNCQAGN